MCQVQYVLKTANSPCFYGVYSLMGQILAQEGERQSLELSENTRDIRKGALLTEIKIVGICNVHYYLHLFLHII